MSKKMTIQQKYEFSKRVMSRVMNFYHPNKAKMPDWMYTIDQHQPTKVKIFVKDDASLHPVKLSRLTKEAIKRDKLLLKRDHIKDSFEFTFIDGHDSKTILTTVDVKIDFK